jgi:hypothetical protein
VSEQVSRIPEGDLQVTPIGFIGHGRYYPRLDPGQGAISDGAAHITLLHKCITLIADLNGLLG